MWVIVLVLVLVLSLLSLSYSTDHVEFAVVLTTIPSRFAWLEPTLSSWLKQDISPSVILIFVPKTYARFRSKSDLVASGEHQSYATWLEFKLSVDFQRELREKTISVLETAMDWGPATKFVGLLEHLEPIRNQYKAVTHWVVGDVRSHLYLVSLLLDCISRERTFLLQLVLFLSMPLVFTILSLLFFL
jgi:hypothetical protein